ncbi:uncharacterized protein PAC_08668 [Phialocephala subalpina]|uniref:Xylanolytic transcriptional activator regulatory domain-containing protein n=1 Tax=Phialocephala subalpina TaxID=576137 RepID=A0A1L7X182_9HELO|nr:uncharacterized protein PAC_08668 [Phialocephala subalpina]
MRGQRSIMSPTEHWNPSIGGIPWPQASDESENPDEEDDDVSRLDAALAHHWPTLINTVSYHGDLAASALDVPDVNPHGSSTEIPLPSYIKARYNMKSDDLQYLWYKGALTIPDTSLKNALLRGYIEYVHPSLPLINLHEFLATTCASNIGEYVEEDQRISLLLFQAILFAGSAFVDQMSLQIAGYSTRREARAAFYQKVKLLYDFDYEIDDKLAVVQSLLLMTYWHEVPSDGKDDWHWLGVAISITTSFHNRAAIVELDARDQKVWNRVWWCCFTRDRLLALGLRRTPRIEEDDCDSFTTPILTLDDFEIRKFGACNLTISLSECRVVQDTSLQLKLAKTFIAKAELCICIGHILKTQYYPQVRDHGIGSEPNGKSRSQVVLLPNPKADGFEACGDELAHWLQSLPTGMLHTTLTAERVAADGDSLIIEQAVLHMIYLATRSTLHRPRALSATPAASLQEHSGPQTSRRIIREASMETTRIHMELYKLNLTRYLPTTAVTVLLPAIISHIQSIKSASNRAQIWKEATKGLAQCMQILQKLRDNYQPADEATHLLEDALRLANIQIVTEPMPTLGTSSAPAGGIHSRETNSAEVSDELSSFVNPQRLEFSHTAHHVSSPPEPTARHHASASRTISITNNNFQAIDPAVSLLSEELAWLDKLPL